MELRGAEDGRWYRPSKRNLLLAQLGGVVPVFRRALDAHDRESDNVADATGGTDSLQPTSDIAEKGRGTVALAAPRIRDVDDRGYAIQSGFQRMTNTYVYAIRPTQDHKLVALALGSIDHISAHQSTATCHPYAHTQTV